MNEKLKIQLDAAVKNIESRPQSEKAIVLVMIIAVLVLTYMSVAFDPVRADISQANSQILNADRQIQAQQTAYAEMLVASQEDPNKFANDRLTVIAREQGLLSQEISSLAGDLITPAGMTRILTSVLERQPGLELVSFQNKAATSLRDEESAASDTSGVVAPNNSASLNDISGQVYEHGLRIEFQGDFFTTLKYLRFLEEVTGSFFWDSISFKQLEWPTALITLEIHTLSTNAGFIGV
ncbi:MAG: hypothetical protein COA96_14735 [SAR86 cluster bacterium]|uniref:MSHA biogenesis protein MshJ n=1 Tax=SAR86 cluster bacterium TaxID=2030880 RepID=A0A2A5ASZ3_9GAMM|nr:MAG: hypothetical protein COA96_14735 [SAR86 cluster bacterium]